MASKIVVFLAACLLMGFAAESQATVIYLTTPSSNSYNSGNSYVIGASSPDNGQSWQECSELPAFGVNSVPEPATIVLLGLGSMILVRKW